MNLKTGYFGKKSVKLRNDKIMSNKNKRGTSLQMPQILKE